MAYTLNPNLPRIRGQAVELVRQGWSTRKVGRHLGFNHTTIVRWVAKSRKLGSGAIPTRSSRPRFHPRALKPELVKRIVAVRFETKRCAEVVHRMLTDQGVTVSLSSVKRTFDRHYLTRKRSPWKRWHHQAARPMAAQPGSLVQVDTIHLMTGNKTRIYVFTLLDICSRWAFAWATQEAISGNAVRFVKLAQRQAPFRFGYLQSDHGPEFGKWFVQQVKISHRHSRVRRPNDNAHLERFNRTLQEEFLDRLPRNVDSINQALPEYLKYYNQERLHLGINLLTPLQVVQRY